MENPPLQPQGATPTPPASPSAAKPYASAAKPYPGSDAAQSSGNGRGWILALAILQIIGGIILFAMSRDTMEPLAAIIMLVIVLGLALESAFLLRLPPSRRSRFAIQVLGELAASLPSEHRIS